MKNRKNIIKKQIKLLESKGFKEYTPSKLEEYDRAWQLKIDDNCSINANLWHLSKLRNDLNDSFEFEIYRTHLYYTSKENLYAFDDKEFEEVLYIAISKAVN